MGPSRAEEAAFSPPWQLPYAKRVLAGPVLSRKELGRGTGSIALAMAMGRLSCARYAPGGKGQRKLL